MLESGAMKSRLGPPLLLFVTLPLPAQTNPAYQPKPGPFGFHMDAMFRQEWTNDIFVSPGVFESDDRWRLQARPRVEFGANWFHVGAGAEFNYSKDDNTDPPPSVLRDNYKSKDARLDLGWLELKPTHWLEVEGGRMFMPIRFTEMIWDKDLRPQGGSAGLAFHNLGPVKSLSATALYGQGSSPFDDEHVHMWAFSADVVAGGSGSQKSFELTGSYVQWSNLADLQANIRRQNTPVIIGAPPFPLADDYKVFDLVARFHDEGKVNTQLVADYCWNTAVDDNRHGLWLALVLGSTQQSTARLEYTYAKIDKDATLGAYNTDDFFWATGWEGHRGDLGFRAGPKSSAHAIASIQRFKDSPILEQRDVWTKRYRLEIRFEY